MNKKLEYNGISGPYESIHLEVEDLVYIHCPKHPRELIKLDVFYGDAYHIYPTSCPLCLEEAKEAGRKEVEENLWQRIIDKIKTWQKEETNE